MDEEKEYFRGDTFVFPFDLQNENKELINFETGDILRFGMKESIYSDTYLLYDEKTISENTEDITIIFKPEKTQKLQPNKNYIIELEITRGDYRDTIFQKVILVKGDVVNNVPKINSDT